MVTVNLEQGMPTVSMAMTRLGQALRSAKAGGAGAVKLIHGYGSSGQGGAIRAAVHRELRQRQRRGEIRAYIPGERFSPFYEEARQGIDLCPELARDRDYTRTNQGITIVVL